MKKIFIFVLGACTGGISTYIYFNIKIKEMEKDFNMELNNITNNLEVTNKDIENESNEYFKKADKIIENCNKDDAKTVKDILQDNNYENEDEDIYGEEYEDEEFDTDGDDEVIDESMENSPYVISIEDFDTKEYETRYWYLLADNVILDEEDNRVSYDEILRSIGNLYDNIENFESDEIHIRNDIEETDYEIKKIHETFSQYMRKDIEDDI